MPQPKRVFSGEKLRQMRLARKLSRMGLARLIPTVGPVTVMQYEMGESTPSLNRALELMRVLNCTIEELTDVSR